jgi:hypothetical protein
VKLPRRSTHVKNAPQSSVQNFSMLWPSACEVGQAPRRTRMGMAPLNCRPLALDCQARTRISSTAWGRANPSRSSASCRLSKRDNDSSNSSNNTTTTATTTTATTTQPQPQQPQQQRDDSWVQPPPEWTALPPIAERPNRDSGSWDTGANPPPPQGPGLIVVNGSPQSDQIQPQPSETSQDLPKLQTDTEPPTFLGDTLVTSPASHDPLHESTSLSKPDSKLDTHASTDAVRPAGGSISPPLNSPGKDSVFSVLPSPYSNQPIHPAQSTFSDIPKTPPRSPNLRTSTPPIRKSSGMEPGSGSPTPSSSSRFQGAIKRREAGSPSNSLPASTKAKTPEPIPTPQMDPHPNSPTFSPTPTTLNTPPTLTHTATTTSTTSKSEYSGYSGPSPPQQVPGVFSSPNRSQSTPSHNGRRRMSYLRRSPCPPLCLEGLKVRSPSRG